MRLADRAAAIAAATGIASFTYQTIAAAVDRRRFPPPGHLADVGGRRLHIVTAGEGSPAVVVIPALADNVLQWLRVLESVAAETRACVYDRARWSDPPAHGWQTPDVMAGDLHALLTAAGVPPPCPGRPFARRPGRAPLLRPLSRPGGRDGCSPIPATRTRPGGWLKRTGAKAPGWHLTMAARRQARILGIRRLATSAGLVRGLDAGIDREAPPEYAGAARAIALSSRQRRVAVRNCSCWPGSGGSRPSSAPSP